MKAADQLASFVREALNRGAGRQEIAAALRAAGWSAREIDGALAAWNDRPGLPPVPRPRAFVSPREALLYGLIFISLAMTAWHLVALSFRLIEIWLPDPALPDEGNWQSSSVRWSVASLVVFFPAFLILGARMERGRGETAQTRRRSGVRKGLGYLTLLLASLTLLGDLVFVLYALLEGELTARFLAKAAVVAAVAALVLGYFRADLAEDDDAT